MDRREFLKAVLPAIAAGAVLPSVGPRGEIVNNTPKPLSLKEMLGDRLLQITYRSGDEQFVESVRFSVDEIARFYCVPSHLIGGLAC